LDKKCNSLIPGPFPLDPDPTAQINADPCGSGSETLILDFIN
jgi:hypothetical protein